MKKIKTLLLALVILPCLVFSLAACNDEHEHTYSSDWASDATNHWHAATCEHTDEKSDVAAHTFDGGTITTASGCTADGVKTFTCTVCQKTKTEAVEKAGHTFDEGVITTAATCDAAGEKTFTCTVCQATTTEAVQKLTHAYSDVLTFSENKWWAACTQSGCLNKVEVTDFTGKTLSVNSADVFVAAYGKNVLLSTDVTVTDAQMQGFIRTIPTNGAATIDVNGNTLNVTSATVGSPQTVVVENGREITIKNSQTKPQFDEITEDDINVVWNTTTTTKANVAITSNSSFIYDNVIVVASANLFPSGDAAKVEIKDSVFVSTGVYAVATNANVVYNYGVHILLTNSIIQAVEASDGDQNAVLVNVPCTLTVSDCEIVGARQGLVVRGGTATVTNSTIKTLGTYTGSSYYTDANWQSGNEVPFAALVIGNRNTAYQYKTEITLTDVILQKADNANSNAKLSYVYANTASGLGVVVNADKDYSLEVGSNENVQIILPQ